MKSIRLSFSNEESMTIKLFDNELTQDLVETFSEFNNTYKIGEISRSTHSTEYYERDLGKNPWIIEKNWNIILKSVHTLKSYGINFLREIPDKFDFSQDTLNYLHRVFTYSSFMSQNSDEHVLTNTSPGFPFTSDYETPKISNDVKENVQEVFKIIEKINSSVHELERYSIPTENSNFLANYKLPNIRIVKEEPHSHEPIKAFWKRLHKYGKYNYDFMSHSEENIVCLNDSIAGKSVLVSFRDDDNPTLADCTGRLITQGEFTIYPNRTLHNLYESSEFKAWLSKHNMTLDEAPLEMAIGYVLESSMPIDNFFDYNENQLSLVNLEWVDE